MTPRKSSSIGPLAGTMFLSVFVLAFTGLFGIWQSHQNADAALTRLGDLSRLNHAARAAQVDFKVQVQDWKNLLLRGQDAGDYADYQKRFFEQSKVVAQALQVLLDSPDLPADLRPKVATIKSAHHELENTYQTALEAYSTTEPATIFAVDRSIRGIDQELNQQIDQVSLQLGDHEVKHLDEVRQAGDKLYQTLRNIALIVSGIAMVCAGILSWRCRGVSQA